MQEDKEALLFLKTRRELVPKLIEAVAEEHPYEVPAISAVPLDRVHTPFCSGFLTKL